MILKNGYYCLPLYSTACAKMTTIQLCAFLETPKTEEWLLSSLWWLPSFSDGAGSCCIHLVPQVVPKKKIWGVKVWDVKCQLKISPEANCTASKVLFQLVPGKLGSVRACCILLKPALSHKQQIESLWFTLEGIEDLNISFFGDCHCCAQFFKEH